MGARFALFAQLPRGAAMRLTLRTMLAYMDGILDPEDAQDIGKKIEDSQYATGLMHRVRDVMRRLRLAAPGLSDRGPNLDPNTVAEYLDNTLSDERVPDFEKVCLESDIHLAEVASCHQILTLVLGEPADVDPASRERMYQIPQVLAAEVGADQRITTAPQLEERAAPAAAADEAPKRPAPEVPEYLRQATQKRSLAAPFFAAVAVVATIVAVLFATKQFEPNTPLGRLIGMRDPAAPIDVQPEEKPNLAPPANVGQPSANDAAGQKSGKPSGSDASEPITRLPEVAPPVDKPVTDQPAGDNPPGDNPPGDNPPGAIPPADQPPADKLPANNPPAEKLPAEKPVTEGPKGNLPGDAANPPADQPAEQPPHGGAVEPQDQPPAKLAGAPEDNKPIGRLISDKQVLLAHEPQTGRYVRVANKAIFLPGTRLLVLPTYRPEIGLSAGTHVRLLGGTEVTLLGPDVQAPSGVNVFFGRLVVMPLGNPGVRVRLMVGDRSGVLTLSQAESMAAIEVAVAHVPGTDPEKTPPQVTSTLYVASGDCLWDDGLGGKPVHMIGPQQMVLDARSPSAPVAVRDLPKWIQGENLGLLDARASALIEQLITTDKPAQTTLLELDHHRQKEMRWLATRSLVYMDQFDTLVAGLNQPDLRADWAEYAAKLTDALALGPETAVAVRDEFQRQYGPEGVDAYRMLWGYSDDALLNGGAAKLVGYLDHDRLVFRVLAYLTLRDITNAGLLYRPEQTPAQRKQATQRWKEKLAAGEIRIKGGDAPVARGVSPDASPDRIRGEGN